MYDGTDGMSLFSDVCFHNIILYQLTHGVSVEGIAHFGDEQGAVIFD
jgi:hypothetical protein